MTSERTHVMGIVNVTPDSFSDGGAFVDEASVDHEAAVEHGLQLMSDGADILDVGGESTRPGSMPVDVEMELQRVLPVIKRLAASGAVVSVDTSKPEVAAAGLDAGAEIINDVTALRSPQMRRVVARAGAGVVLMHMQGTPLDMQHDPQYEDVAVDVRDELVERASAAESDGVDRRRICLDPGIGFGKTHGHNLELLDRLGILAAAGYPLLVGTSRKGFLGRVLGGVPAQQRDVATGATIAMAVDRGAAIVRVHNVVVATHSARVADAIVQWNKATEQM